MRLWLGKADVTLRWPGPHVGREGYPGKLLKLVALYDPNSGAWVIFPSNPMNAAHSGHTSTRLLDGTVLICGGLGYDGQPEAESEVFFPY